jgi:hypothetical protein
LTIKSTSHTTRRYFLLRLHTCVSTISFTLPPGMTRNRTKPTAVFCMPVKYSIVKDRFIPEEFRSW